MSLQVGNPAPDFSAEDQNGNLVKLSSFLGKKVVLYFYPKDDTPGCTAQACNLRDNYESLLKNNFIVLGVSGDDVKSHKKFADKFNLPFPLVADPDKKINESYGVWKEKSMYGRQYMGTMRTTFLIDEQGIISEIIDKIKTDDHTTQIIK